MKEKRENASERGRAKIGKGGQWVKGRGKGEKRKEEREKLHIAFIERIAIAS